MNLVASCVLSVVSIYAVAVTCLLIVWTVSRGKMGVAWVLGGGVALCPLLIPANEVIARALVSVLCADAWFKSVDLARVLSRKRVSPPSFRTCLEILLPFPIFLSVFEDRRRRPLLKIETADLQRVAVGGSLAIMGVWTLDLLYDVRALRESFVLDHIVKLLLFVATTESLSQLMLGVERLAGFDAGPIIRRAFLSKTVGEFWCRYNTRVHRWLQYNVFLPSGGMKSPVWGILLAFLVSAVFHELMFGIATSRFDGYQFAFFMIQAPGVLMSQQVEQLRLKYGSVISLVNRLLTILWFGVTSILFFHGVDRVFHRVYASTPWLP